MKASNKKLLKDLVSRLESIKEEMESIKEEEQGIFDERSERWQEGDKGMEAEEKLDLFDDAINDIETAIETLNEEVIGG